MEGFEEFQDLEHVKHDVKKVKDGFKLLGAQMLELHVFKNLDHNGFETLFNELRKKIASNWENNRQKTLVFFYYAGHAVIDN